MDRWRTVVFGHSDVPFINSDGHPTTWSQIATTNMTIVDCVLCTETPRA